MLKLYKSLLLSISLFLFAYLAIAAQPILTVTTNDLSYGGFLFMTPTDYQACTVVDLAGDIVYSYTVNLTCHNFNRLDNGDWIYYDSANKQWEQYAPNSTTLKATYSISGSDNDSHDIIVRDNYVWLMGRGEYVGITGTLALTLRGSTLQKQDLSGNVLFDWHSKDYISTGEAILPIRQNSSFPHSNSFYEDTDGNLIVSFRNVNSVMKICVNGNGCEPGEIIWRLGGIKSDFAFINDRGIAKQHSAIMTDRCHGGVDRCLLLFDNGNDFDPQYSRAVEFVLGQGIVTKTWEYTADGQIYAFATGNVSRLDNGDTVIGWGHAHANDPNDPTVTVVDWGGNVKYEAILPEGIRTYRVLLYPEWQIMYLPLVAR